MIKYTTILFLNVLCKAIIFIVVGRYYSIIYRSLLLTELINHCSHVSAYSVKVTSYVT